VEGKLFLEAHCLCHGANDFPVGLRVANRLQSFADALHAALGVHEGAVLLERRARRQKDVPESTRQFVHEQILHDNEVQLRQRGFRCHGVRVRRRHVVAYGPQRLQLLIGGSVHHLHKIQAGSVWHRRLPDGLE
jgi:hypothetical protein